MNQKQSTALNIKNSERKVDVREIKKNEIYINQVLFLIKNGIEKDRAEEIILEKWAQEQLI